MYHGTCMYHSGECTVVQALNSYLESFTLLLHMWKAVQENTWFKAGQTVLIFLYCLTRAIRYSYTASCCGLSGIHEAVIQLEPRLLIE